MGQMDGMERSMSFKTVTCRNLVGCDPEYLGWFVFFEGDEQLAHLKLLLDLIISNNTTLLKIPWKSTAIKKKVLPFWMMINLTIKNGGS